MLRKYPSGRPLLAATTLVLAGWLATPTAAQDLRASKEFDERARNLRAGEDGALVYVTFRGARNLSWVDVYLDGADIGRLATGLYLYTRHAPGAVDLIATTQGMEKRGRNLVWSEQLNTRLRLELRAGHIHWIEMRANRQGRYNYVDLHLIDHGSQRPSLAGLRLARSNSYDLEARGGARVGDGSWICGPGTEHRRRVLSLAGGWATVPCRFDETFDRVVRLP